jgi:hypothetical protein
MSEDKKSPASQSRSSIGVTGNLASSRAGAQESERR